MLGFIMFITEFSYNIKFKVIYIIHYTKLINYNNNVHNKNNTLYQQEYTVHG